MPTINVYVSAELKARMDAVGEGANWSAAAQDAFQRILTDQEWKMQTDQLERAAARLRASKAAYYKSEAETGRERGRSWALAAARYEDLLRLSQIDLRNATAETVALTASGTSKEDYSPRMAYEWWEEEMPSDEYAAAFAEGAVEVFSELRDQL